MVWKRSREPKGTSSTQLSGASLPVEPVSPLSRLLVAGPRPLRNRRSILSHFLLQTPRAFGCRPWWPCVVSGTTAQEPRDPPLPRAGYGELVMCVFYLILTDHMFQEPFPVNKDSIKLMKKKIPLWWDLRPMRRRAEGFWWPQLCSWKRNSC